MSNQPNKMQIDRLPPHSIEAEQGVLGCILLDPQQAMGMVVEKFKAGSEAFFDLRHRTIYELMVEMYDKQEAIDAITLQQRLRDRRQLDSCGGLSYIASLPDVVPSAANIDYYAEIVREKFILRKTIQTCTQITSRAYEHAGESDEFLDAVEKDILKISEARAQSEMVSTKELVKRAVIAIESAYERKGQLTGLATGYPQFDSMTNGLHPGEMTVIAARPSMGKTSLAMNIAEYVATELKQPVGVFSLEMPADSLMLRMICSRARCNMREVTQGILTEPVMRRLGLVTGKFAAAPIYIDDTAGLSIMQLRAKARRMHQQYGVKLFVIDYLQLLHTTNRRAENRQQEVADISSGVKGLAKELSVPIIALSQLNREVESRDSGKPRLSDLRETGAIEQDADLVGLLYKADPDNRKKAGRNQDEDSGTVDSIPVNLLIAKQRNGPTGDVYLTFIKSITRFESSARTEPSDV